MFGIGKEVTGHLKTESIAVTDMYDAYNPLKGNTGAILTFWKCIFDIKKSSDL